MNFGRQLVNVMRKILGTKVKGYKPYMEIHISTQMDNLPEDEYNEYMDSIVNNDSQGINEFVKFAQNIVNKLI
jgi:hypothetical protein